jgi:hypothetical protein
MKGCIGKDYEHVIWYVRGIQEEIYHFWEFICIFKDLFKTDRGIMVPAVTEFCI